MPGPSVCAHSLPSSIRHACSRICPIKSRSRHRNHRASAETPISSRIPSLLKSIASKSGGIASPFARKMDSIRVRRAASRFSTSLITRRPRDSCLRASCIRTLSFPLRSFDKPGSDRETANTESCLPASRKLHGNVRVPHVLSLFRDCFVLHPRLHIVPILHQVHHKVKHGIRIPRNPALPQRIATSSEVVLTSRRPSISPSRGCHLRSRPAAAVAWVRRWYWRKVT